MAQVIPWPNFVNHNQHGVDTTKYYQQAERELEAEKLSEGSLRWGNGDRYVYTHPINPPFRAAILGSG